MISSFGIQWAPPPSEATSDELCAPEETTTWSALIDVPSSNANAAQPLGPAPILAATPVRISPPADMKPAASARSNAAG
eukprot:CAMPEP_0183347480 /NCGR_PEP_ID=MMETSP0164_2-20130417/12295_1 /TAXON_ID=221442 /ORGANISM="Coccolithus pelagicus ssp braarudi, Strain PLY182g" /LENGTH=78 /DNA_ID=CAMNT_0025518913 /DNA_START=544 /DNA_END=778 /DNA_ORIENTATION=-